MITKLLNQQVGQIAPFEIVFFNELNLPIRLPFLQLLLAGNRLHSGFVGLHVYKPIHAVFADKFGATSQPVLLESKGKVVRYADKGAVSPASENVEIGEHVMAAC